MEHPFLMFLDHTQRRSTVGRTPLDEEEQTFMYSAGFEPAIPASERPQTNALDRAATGIVTCLLVKYKRDKKSLLHKPKFWPFHLLGSHVLKVGAKIHNASICMKALFPRCDNYP